MHGAQVNGSGVAYRLKAVRIPEAMRNRRIALSVKCPDVDLAEGLQEGYSNKLENWPKEYGRRPDPKYCPCGSAGCVLV